MAQLIDKIIYVINGHDGRTDGGLVRLEPGSLVSVVWFETREKAQCYIDVNDPYHIEPFEIEAMTARKLREDYGYEWWSKSDGETVGMPWRIPCN